MSHATTSRLDAILWDWDGTLIDSAPASYACYQEVFRHFGIAFDRKRFEATYSPNWYATYRALALEESAWPEADARWVRCFERQACALLPGAREALAAACTAGLRQALVTSGTRARVEPDLDRHELDGTFEVVICSADVSKKKPHPEGLLNALDRMGIEPAHAAYVGDSPEDIEMARAVGALAIGIPGGFPNREALIASVPDRIAYDPLAAVEWLIGRSAT